MAEKLKIHHSVSIRDLLVWSFLPYGLVLVLIFRFTIFWFLEALEALSSTTTSGWFVGSRSGWTLDRIWHHPEPN